MSPVTLARRCALTILLATSLPSFAGVVVSDPWVRGTVPAQRQTAAYMRISSDREVRLAGASSPVAGSALVHEMRMDGDVMRMRPVDSLRIPAGGTVVLDERGLHLMLQELRRPLQPGERVELELRFVDTAGKAELVRISAPVRPLGAASGGTH